MRTGGWLTSSQAARHLYDPGPCAVQERLVLASHLLPRRRSLAAWGFVAFLAVITAITVSGCDDKRPLTQRAAVLTERLRTVELPPCSKLVSASYEHTGATWSYAVRPMRLGEVPDTGLLCVWEACIAVYVEQCQTEEPTP